MSSATTSDDKKLEPLFSKQEVSNFLNKKHKFSTRYIPAEQIKQLNTFYFEAQAKNSGPASVDEIKSLASILIATRRTKSDFDHQVATRPRFIEARLVQELTTYIQDLKMAAVAVMTNSSVGFMAPELGSGSNRAEGYIQAGLWIVDKLDS
jgi:hypothetical protein